VVSRDAVAATMVVLRDPGEAYLLRHTGGPAIPGPSGSTRLARRRRAVAGSPR
jgi:hypothetical protein